MNYSKNLKILETDQQGTINVGSRFHDVGLPKLAQSAGKKIRDVMWSGSYFYDAKLNKVKTVPYKHNYGYFFTSGPNTWHGMEKKEIKKERRCIQVNYVTFPTDWKVY